MSTNHESKEDTLETYFRALDAGDFELASEQFTTDVSYLHPPMYSDTTHLEGRDALYDYLHNVRGKTDTVHVTDQTIADGDTVALTGHVEKRGNGDVVDRYVAFAVFEDGLVDYYIAGLLNG